MREFEDVDKIPPSVRALLRDVTVDREWHTDFWNSPNRRLDGKRPRVLWHEPGGAARVKAFLRKAIK